MVRGDGNFKRHTVGALLHFPRVTLHAVLIVNSGITTVAASNNSPAGIKSLAMLSSQILREKV